MDLMSVYLSPSLGVGQRLNLDTIDRRLRRLPLERTLALLSQINFDLDQPLDPALQHRVTQELFRPPVRRQALQKLADPRFVVASPQTLLNLALRALRECPIDGEDDVPDERLRHQLGDLILGLADHTSRDSAAGTLEESIALEIVRLELFFRTHDLSSWLEVTDRLLFDCLPTMKEHPDFIDLDRLSTEVWGMSLSRFWALTTAFGMVAHTDRSSVTLNKRIFGGNVSDDEVERWAEAWSIDLDQAQDLATTDLAAGGWWSFRTFYASPVLQLRNGALISLRPAFVAMKAIAPMMFWAVRDPYVAAGGDHLRLSRFFGAGVEEVGRRLVAQHFDREALVDESEVPVRWGNGSACDLTILGRRWIAIDFVFHQVTKRAAVDGNFGDLMKDVEKVAIKKAVQIDRTLVRALVYEPRPSEIIPLIVVGAHFPNNPILTDHIERALRAEEPEVLFSIPECRRPAVIDLAELHFGLRVASALERDFGDLLSSWLDSNLYSSSFRNWLVTYGPAHSVPERETADEPAFRRVARELYDVETFRPDT